VAPVSRARAGSCPWPARRTASAARGSPAPIAAAAQRQAVVNAGELSHDDVEDLVGSSRVAGGALRVV
jgi:hypothetical protein